MSDLVDPTEVEALVGAMRHEKFHQGRAVTADRTVIVLHSGQCRDSGIDLRTCVYSLALDRGIDRVAHLWEGQFDQPVVLLTHNGHLVPMPEGARTVHWFIPDVELCEEYVTGDVVLGDPGDARDLVDCPACLEWLHS